MKSKIIALKLTILLIMGCSDTKHSPTYYSPKKKDSSALFSNRYSEKKAYLNEKRVLPPELKDREKYEYYGENPRTSPLINPVSTFSIDVDTASYTNARRYINRMNKLPPKSSIRVEEFINYFDYNYPLPKSNNPFSINFELAQSPFDNNRLLLHIGLKGKEIPFEKRPASNLVFLLDVSGSMNSEFKLGLLKKALIMLTDQMTEKDKVSIVVYAGSSGVVLLPTNGNKKAEIKNALNRLSAGGSTAGSEGIQLAYKMAERAYIKNGINRVILATDGDFNVGITDHKELITLIENKRKSGIALTVLGFGMWNLNDRTMEQLANKGNGNYFYIDSSNEAKKVLVNELGSTLQIIAKDVKVQIEFNPKYISSYRLIGYENRKLSKEQFDDDTVDAGDIGAGHSITAIYELTMTSRAKDQMNLRYGEEHSTIKKGIKKTNTTFKDEIAFFKLRYKPDNGKVSKLITKPLLKSDLITNKPSNNFIFSASVAYFAQKLRESKYSKGIGYNKILNMMASSKGEDKWGYRQECENLIRKAKTISKG